MRKKIKTKKQIQVDPRFNSQKVAKFINYIMKNGKKEKARKIVYKAFEIIKEKTKNPNPLEVFDLAVKNVSPLVEVRSRRVGGANYQVPCEVRPDRRLMLAFRWIRDSARQKKGAPMAEKLAEEIILASKNQGEAYKKKEIVHKMAEANKAFAHLAW